MSIYKTIITHIDRLASYNKDYPIRVSYYDTYCTIYILTKPIKTIHIDYKPIERALSNIESTPICQLCSIEASTQISCFECGNLYCVICFVKMICTNYSLGNYNCPYCKYINVFSNDKSMLESVFLTLYHFKLNYDEINYIVVRVIAESPGLLKI